MSSDRISRFNTRQRPCRSKYLLPSQTNVHRGFVDNCQHSER